MPLPRSALSLSSRVEDVAAAFNRLSADDVVNNDHSTLFQRLSSSSELGGPSAHAPGTFHASISGLSATGHAAASPPGDSPRYSLPASVGSNSTSASSIFTPASLQHPAPVLGKPAPTPTPSAPAAAAPAAQHEQGLFSPLGHHNHHNHHASMSHTQSHSCASSVIGSSRGGSPPAMLPGSLTVSADSDPYHTASLLASVLSQSAPPHGGSPGGRTAHAVLHVAAGEASHTSHSSPHPSEAQMERLMGGARCLLQAAVLANQDLSSSPHTSLDVALLPFLPSPPSGLGSASDAWAMSVLALGANLPAAVCMAPASAHVVVGAEGNPQLKAQEITTLLSSGVQVSERPVHMGAQGGMAGQCTWYSGYGLER